LFELNIEEIKIIKVDKPIEIKSVKIKFRKNVFSLSFSMLLKLFEIFEKKLV